MKKKEYKKVAGRFKAWQLTIQVGVDGLDGALDHCEDLGLEPRLLARYKKHNGKREFLFQVVVPCCAYKEGAQAFVSKELGSFHALRVGEANVELICPPNMS